MQDQSIVSAILLGILEGLTEFIPVSSTGHILLAGHFLGFESTGKAFEVLIQLGAIMAILSVYFARLWKLLVDLPRDPKTQRFVVGIVLAFLPAAILGILFAGSIKTHLFKPVPVAIAFIVGGLIIFWVEHRQRMQRTRPRVFDLDDLRVGDALKLGIAQAFSLIPGTSRSGATIIGGMLFGLSRKTATEFSFFLAIPTLIGAGVYDLLKYRDILSPADIPLFAVGLGTAFFSALACVHWLIRFVASNSFVVFAWYRIAFGVVVLLTAATGTVNWSQ